MSVFAEACILQNLSISPRGATELAFDAISSGPFSRAARSASRRRRCTGTIKAFSNGGPNPRNRLRLAVFGDSDSLAVLFRTPDDAAPTFAGQVSIATQFHIAQLSWLSELAPTTHIKAMLSLGWIADQLSGGDQLALNISYQQFNSRIELSHALSGMVRLNLGIDLLTGPTAVSFSGVRLDSGQSATSPQQIGANIHTVVFQPGTYAELELDAAAGTADRSRGARRLVPRHSPSHRSAARDISVDPAVRLCTERWRRALCAAAGDFNRALRLRMRSFLVSPSVIRSSCRSKPCTTGLASSAHSRESGTRLGWRI